MQLIYKGVDITNRVGILQANINDTAGGESDSVELLLSDTDKIWRQWGPEKSDILEVKHNGFSSGIMYIYFIQDLSGKLILKGRSIPSIAKTERTKAWENVRFNDIAGDIAGRYGFTVESYGTSNWQYDRLDQISIPDLKFLSDRCMLESCCLKVNNKKIIVYYEPYMEAQAPAIKLSWNDLLGERELSTISEGLFNSCQVHYLDKSNKLISYKFSPSVAPEGPELKYNFRVPSQGEAERAAKGLLRNKNRWETQGNIFIKLNLTIAAGNILQLSDMGHFSGKYFIYSCCHKLQDDISHLKIRKVLEGY